jgi:histidinol-phosphate aminotransferase
VSFAGFNHAVFPKGELQALNEKEVLLQKKSHGRDWRSYVRPEILAMHGYIPGEQPRDWNIVKLNTNENPYPPSPAVIETIEAALHRGLQRYPDPLATQFREVAGRLLGFDPEWILCGNGSDDVLTIITRTFVRPGGLVRFAYPGYLLYETLAELQGARVDRIFFREDWTLGPEFAHDSPGLSIVFLANPNSPSGTMIAPKQVAQWAEMLPCPLVVDEAYADFAPYNCLELVREYDNVLVVRSLSKSYALAGLRFGFVVAQPHLIEHLRKVKDSYNCDVLSIAGATAAISDQNWFVQTRAKIVRTRERLRQEMQRLGFSVADSQANFTWNVHPEVPARELYEHLKRRNILVRYMNFPDWGDGIRITVGTDEQIDTCLAEIRNALEGRVKES